MMANLNEIPAASTCIEIHVVEPGTRTRRGSMRCEIGRNVSFSTASLESYFFAQWEPRAYDALLVAAAIEFGDRTQRRPFSTWQREIGLHIPVHNPEHWNNAQVSKPLHDALDFLTGDRWNIEFSARKEPFNPPRQGQLSLNNGADAVMPFSNGLDSRAVAGLLALDLGERLIRVRLGSNLREGEIVLKQKHPFTAVPYQVHSGERDFVESTARSRGFKFAVISGLAAYLADAAAVIVPESGQGALGPALVPVGQAYQDYRSHPLFTDRMETFLKALLGHTVKFRFPRLWHTKAETLAEFVRRCEDATTWSTTRSCWQQSRHVSVDQKHRQCGICAACMLRRMSVHAAGLSEPKEIYVWEDLTVPTFLAGVAQSFDKKRITPALREYAIAGALHLDHLAELENSPANSRMLDLNAFQLSGSLGLPQSEIRARLNRLLVQHGSEWRNFMFSLGQKSFVADWAMSARS